MPQRRDLIEWPDPIVAAYLTRVRSLSDAERSRLWSSDWVHLWRVLWRDKPAALRRAFSAYFRAWMTRQLSMARGNDPDALREYRVFWQEIRSGAWTAGARTCIAVGLSAVRMRQYDHDAAVANYTACMERAIPRRSIDWRDAPSA